MIKTLSAFLLLFLILFTSDLYADKSSTPAGKIYQSIQSLVSTYNKHPNQVELSTILKKYSQLYKYDTSYFSYDLIYPIYNKDKATFNKVLKTKLSEEERKIILFNIAGYENEQKNGNDL